MRVLMLGNSLTTAHDLPRLLLARLSERCGAKVEVVVHARGGARLSEHLNPKTKNGARTLRALGRLCGERQAGLDFVVLQEMSHAPATTPEAYLRAASGLCELARSAGARPVIYGTWAYERDSAALARLVERHPEACGRACIHCPHSDVRREGPGVTDGFAPCMGMHGLMHGAFATAAREGGAVLADVGSAFVEYHGVGSPYSSDGVHPSEVGALLAADVIARAIAGAWRNPPASGGLSQGASEPLNVKRGRRTR